MSKNIISLGLDKDKNDTYTVITIYSLLLPFPLS